ncbi:putative Se/S carrier-like protein [Clostridium sp.]|uniref:putative Se/S carrier-like protein n=1 Tax=Clostridium sp. TaxID=1506 RepID=UPI003D6CA18E
MDAFYIIVLNSSSVSVHLFKLLKDKKLNVVIMSTPCTISAGCSRSIKIKECDLEAAIEEIDNHKIIIKGIYKKVYKENRFYYLKIR